MDTRGAAQQRPTATRRFGREDVEFGRSVGYIDATFAFAATLLVTTVDPGEKGWGSWTEFSAEQWQPLLAFALSFTVISVCWWANHQLVATLERLSPRFVLSSLVLLAFIALVPFTTDGLGDFDTNGEVATVCYALNIAAVSLASSALVVIAYFDGLYRVPLTVRDLRAMLVGLIDTPIVFLVSVPIALFVSAGWARAFWISLLVTGAATTRLSRSMQR